MNEISALGTPQDLEARTISSRKDDLRYQRLIQLARHKIYVRNFGVSSEAVEKLLYDESLVPTTVSLGPHILNYREPGSLLRLRAECFP